MNDPYKVLGVPRNALDDQIKAAYRELVKKYHPDNYVNSNLADVANEKMQEVNQAYDTIMNERKASSDNNSNNFNNNSYYSYNNYNNSEYASKYAYIRSYIHSNRLIQAEEELNNIPTSLRDAEWHFLKGSLFLARGWLDDATSQFETAYKMNPNNPEYRDAYNRMMWKRQGYMGNPYGQTPYRSPRGGNVGGCSTCDMCSGLLCADCCCECFGGDLISCC